MLHNINFGSNVRLQSGLVLKEESGRERDIGQGLKAEIHEENMNILSRLSDEEILQKQHQLEKMLSKEVKVSFFLNFNDFLVCVCVCVKLQIQANSCINLWRSLILHFSPLFWHMVL